MTRITLSPHHYSKAGGHTMSTASCHHTSTIHHHREFLCREARLQLRSKDAMISRFRVLPRFDTYPSFHLSFPFRDDSTLRRSQNSMTFERDAQEWRLTEFTYLRYPCQYRQSWIRCMGAFTTIRSYIDADHFWMHPMGLRA